MIAPVEKAIGVVNIAFSDLQRGMELSEIGFTIPTVKSVRWQKVVTGVREKNSDIFVLHTFTILKWMFPNQQAITVGEVTGEQAHFESNEGCVG